MDLQTFEATLFAMRKYIEIRGDGAPLIEIYKKY